MTGVGANGKLGAAGKVYRVGAFVREDGAIGAFSRRDFTVDGGSGVIAFIRQIRHDGWEINHIDSIYEIK